MTIGDHKPTATPDERRKIRYGTARQITIAVAAAVAAAFGLFVLATQ